MGSSDLDNWIQDAKDSTVDFFTEHLEKPVSFFFIILLDLHSFFLLSMFHENTMLGKMKGV